MNFTQSGSIGVAVDKLNPVGGQSLHEARREVRIAFAGCRNNVLRVGAGNEVGLRVVPLAHQAEQVPANSQVEGEIPAHLPVILEVKAAVIPAIVDPAEVRESYAIGADAARPRGVCGRKQELRASGGAVGLVGNRHVRAVEAERTARSGRSDPRKIHELAFPAAFERVGMVNLGEVLRELHGVAEPAADQPAAHLTQSGEPADG